MKDTEKKDTEKKDAGKKPIKKKTVKKRDRLFGYGGALLLMCALLLQALARSVQGFASWYARCVYPVLVAVIGRICGIFPFSVVEMALYLLVLWLAVFVACVGIARRDWRRVASKVWFLCGLLLFSYTANCGINYYAAPFSSFSGFQTSLYSREELIELCTYLVEKANENVTDEQYQEHGYQWRQEGVRSMEGLGAQYPVMGGFYPPPKEVAVSWILSVQQLCGIYSPFTIEANFNGDMTDYNVPHSICHELSHLKGFMREDEANFIGYLACIGSGSQAFRYSGYLTGWVYAGNALARSDWDAYVDLSGKLCQKAREDLSENNAFWDRYEGKVAEAANQVNDVYLKANDQKDGVQSYGRMVDLMLAYYRDGLAERTP